MDVEPSNRLAASLARLAVPASAQAEYLKELGSWPSLDDEVRAPARAAMDEMRPEAGA